MGLIGNKEETNNEPKTVDVTEQEKQREETAIRFTVVQYNDGNIELKDVKNVRSRDHIEFLMGRLLKSYEQQDLAQLTALTMIDALQKAKQQKSKIINPFAK